MNFRNVDRKLCVIQDSRFVLAIDPERKTLANAVLFCGYIDHNKGISYEAMGLIRCEGDAYVLVPNAPPVGLKVRADTVDERLVKPFEDKKLEDQLRSRIDLLAVYYSDKDVVETRRYEEFDPFRNQHYPDDICALFLTPEHRLERMWVRAKKAVRTDSGTLLLRGRLLNEPRTIPSLHIGENVTLTVIETRHGKQCVGIPGLQWTI